MSRRAIFLVLLSTAVACNGDQAAATPTPATGTQAAASIGPDAPRRYDQDDPGDVDVELPAAIARALQTDELVLDCADGAPGGSSRFEREWVGVRRHDLDGDGSGEWIVNGLHACLRQAREGPAYWWVYAPAPYPGNGERLLLRAEPARSLEVLEQVHNGHQDLRSHHISGRGEPLVSENRFDGTFYVPPGEYGR